MAQLPNGFAQHLCEMGLPPEAGGIMVAAVRRAGFDPEKESEQFIGLVALTSALQIHDAATRVVARVRGRAGRNDPCPCGSGRKFKKCCQGKGDDAATPAPGGPPFPLDAPDLVPRLHQAERFAEDMDTLYRLFQDDPGLSRVRFDGVEALGYVAEAMGDEPDDPPEGETADAAEQDEDRPQQLEELVVRYLQEVEGEEALGDLEGALVAAAPRWAHSVADLRALAAGLALAGMPADEGEGGEGEANPLHILIFRRTLQEAVATHEVVENLVAQASGTDPAEDEPEPAGRLGKKEEG